MVTTFQVRRRALIGLSYREGGEPAPEAHLWRLSEGLVRSGTLVEVEMSEADFAAAIAKFCPADGPEICGKLGLEILDIPAPPPPPRTPGRTPGRPRQARTVVVAPAMLIDPQE